MLWSVWIVLILSIPLSGNEYYYYFCFAFIVVAGVLEKYVSYISQGYEFKTSTVRHSTLYKYPFIMIGIWIFGAVIGLLCGNGLKGVISNFAGVVCYFIVFILAHRSPVDSKVLSSSIYKASIIATIFTIVAFELNKRQLQIWPFNSVQFNSHSLTLYSSVEALIFILEAICVWKIFGEKNSICKKGIYIVLLFLATWALIKTNTMGGFRLGYVAVLGIILYCAVFSKFTISRRQKCAIDAVLVVLILGIVVCDFLFGGILSEVFSTADAGNSKRMYQLEMVIDRFKLWGNGNGAEFVYSYGGRDYAGYGIEVSYFNMIDKYGILSLVMFYILFSPILISMQALVYEKKDVLIYVMVIGASGYMFIALGNPVIFSNYNVILNGIMIYLLASKSVEERANATVV